MIGKLDRDVDVSYEYGRLAADDERVGIMLKNAGEYRHSIYFLIQAMEKYIRAKIFSLVNAQLQYYRDQERHHSVEDAAAFLLKVVHTNDEMRNRISKQLHDFVLGDIRFNHLHNDLRYPYYSERHKSFICLNVGKSDCDLIVEKLNALKSFLAGIDRIR